jgi:hypothetical protein
MFWNLGGKIMLCKVPLNARETLGQVVICKTNKVGPKGSKGERKKAKSFSCHAPTNHEAWINPLLPNMKKLN